MATAGGEEDCWPPRPIRWGWNPLLSSSQATPAAAVLLARTRPLAEEKPRRERELVRVSEK